MFVVYLHYQLYTGIFDIIKNNVSANILGKCQEYSKWNLSNGPISMPDWLKERNLENHQDRNILH
jgi:hypothetical protein